MIKEINGRWTCTKCGYEWSACISDDKVPNICGCEEATKLTKAMKKEYIASDQSICPYCKSDDIEGGFVEIDTSGAWQPVSCNECMREWNDIYKLVDMEVKS